VELAGCSNADSPSTTELNAAKASIAAGLATTVNRDDVTQEPLPNCTTLCDPNKPSYLCLFAGSVGADRNKQIAVLVARLKTNQPIKLTHDELLKIFALQNSGF